MASPKKRLANWFFNNFEVAGGGQYWTIYARTWQGCLLICLLILLVFIILFSLPLFWTYIVFTTAIARLGIPLWLGITLLIFAFFGCFINLPLFILTRTKRSHQKFELIKQKFELVPLWLMRCLCSSAYSSQNPPCGYIGLNITGGLLPILLAFYQFYRAPISKILVITAIVAFITYFLVIIIPGITIVTRLRRIWLIATVAAVLAIALVSGSGERLDVPVAFAGAVLGTVIGADLLHLKDVRPEVAPYPLSIGGAGFKDGIVECGVWALMITEWLPTGLNWLTAYL